MSNHGSTNNKPAETIFIPEPDESTKKRQNFFNDWGSTIVTVIVCVGIVVGGKMAGIVKVNGYSMVPTYNNGDVLVTRPNDISTHDDITYDDIVVCSIGDRGDSVKDSEKKLVKRVVGIPGDTLQVIDGKLYRNGSLLKDDFPAITDAGVLDTEIKLNDNEYFVMGDNRNNSYDSRSFGPIIENEILKIVKFKLF